MWEERKLEARIKKALVDEFGRTRGETVFGQYTGARQILLEDVLSEIRGTEPFLTDHGPDHIANVLDNVQRLLPAEGNYFTAIELYLLGLGVLFHDVGNLDGREGHNQKIGKFYDLARPGEPERTGFEKRLVVSASKAHTGKNRAGSRDTLNDVVERAHYDGNPVRLREIAAVIRFADELAEGRQRTSLFLQAEGRYSPESAIHHRYASVTDVAIDRELERIALTYYVVLEKLGDSREEQLTKLVELLKYMYSRIAKLDEERKYARFHSDLLLPFRNTSVQIDVVEQNNYLDLGLEQIVLSDKIVPEGQAHQLPAIHPSYDPERIAARINSIPSSADTGSPVRTAEQSHFQDTLGSRGENPSDQRRD